MTTTRRIVAVVSMAVTLAVGVGSAWAGEFNVTKQGSEVLVPSHVQRVATSAPSTQPTIVHVTTAGGFNWGDAAIGAAAGIAIVILIVGGGLVLTQRGTGGHLRHA
jgi:hypothetical protein